MIRDMLKNILWLGHDAFRISSGKTIYFDPFQIVNGEPADLILISHDHFDHCSPEDVRKIQGLQTTIVTEENSAKKLKGHIQVLKPGDKTNIQGIEIEAVPAYNTDKNFHPKANQWLGFVLTIGGVRIYHAGDTDFIPEMKDVKADIALLPVSGTYVMTAEEAVQAALTISPEIAIPMHYGSIVGSEKDAERFRRLLEGKIDVLVLKQNVKAHG